MAEKEAIKDEVSLVQKLYELLEQQENKPYGRAYRHINLASKDFQGIWYGWWKGETPPKLEVDMVFAFEDTENLLDNALIIATEVKFFQNTKRNFFEGIQQAMAFSIFGFDGLVLWHIFSEKLDEKTIKNYVKATQEIIGGFGLPIFYLATKITNQFKFKCFAPSQTYEHEIDYLVSWMRGYCMEKRNPLLGFNDTVQSLFRDIDEWLFNKHMTVEEEKEWKRQFEPRIEQCKLRGFSSAYSEEIKKRRNTLKVMLKIAA